MYPGNEPRERFYVDVISLTREDGSVKPLAIRWNDGRTFQIERSSVVVNPLEYLDRFTTMYLVRIRGRNTKLYFERHSDSADTLGRWYVFKKKGKEPWWFGRSYGE